MRKNPANFFALPDDAEEQDEKHIQEYIDAYMDASYPKFEPEVVCGEHKDYYLPALKVLDYDGDYFYSPMKITKWENMELCAECKNADILGIPGNTYIKMIMGIWSKNAPDDEVESEEVQHKHKVPNEDCECGIYGSVNIEEMREWTKRYSLSSIGLLSWDTAADPKDFPPKPKKTVLCLIEPSPNADVILCRKGWKASQAFISEVIYSTHPLLKPTMSIEHASQLLSIAWKRNIDVKGVFENEDR